MSIARWKDVWRRVSGLGIYPHELAIILLLPLRRMFLSPERLVRHLQLTATSRVLEVGPGPGFFSIAVAEAIPRGRLELVDIQIEMLQKARRRLRRAGVTHAGYTQATAVTLPFAPGSFDVAFLVAALGEVSHPKACLASIADVLRPGGFVSVVELPGDPDALTDEQVRMLADGTGLELVESTRGVRGTLVRFRRANAGTLNPGTLNPGT